MKKAKTFSGRSAYVHNLRIVLSEEEAQTVRKAADRWHAKDINAALRSIFGDGLYSLRNLMEEEEQP